MSRFFFSCYLLIQKNKGLSLLMALLFLVVCGGIGSQITWEEDITQILPQNEETALLSKVLKQQNFADKIMVLFHTTPGGDTDYTRQTAHAFVDSLSTVSHLIKKIDGQMVPETLQTLFDDTRAHLPLFLTENDYIALAQRIEKDSITQLVANHLRTLSSPSGWVSRDFIIQDPLGLTFQAMRHFEEISGGDDFRMEEGFITTADGQTVLLFITPAQVETNAPENHLLVNYLRKLQHNLTTVGTSNTEILLYGTPVVAIANELQIKNDLLITISLAIGILMLILIAYYRSFWIPLIIFIPVIFGGACALLALYLLKPVISAVSLSVSAVLIGITTDYSLHILTHFKHNHRVDRLYQDITRPIFISSVTTAAAFLCLFFVNSPVLNDLGLFAAICVLATAFFALLFIPNLYRPRESSKATSHVIDRIAAYPFEQKKTIWIPVLLFFVGSLFTLDKIQFDSDLDHLNYLPTDAQQADILVTSQDSTMQSLVLVAYGENKQQVLQKNTDLYQLLIENKETLAIPVIQSAGPFLLSDKEQQQRIQTWNTFWEKHRQSTQENLINAGISLGFKPETHHNFYQLLSQTFTPQDPENYLPETLTLVDDFLSVSEGFYTLSTRIQIPPHNIPVLETLVGDMGQVLILDRKKINEQMLTQLQLDFSDLINYSTVLILILLWLFYKRIELVLINLVALVIAGVLFLGLLYVFDQPFNVFSFIVCSLIFGLAIDFSVLLTSGLQKEHTTGEKGLPTYKASIILAVLTTIFAIGSLIFAKHPALQSISSIALIGICTAMIVNFCIVPLLFRQFILNRTQKGLSPISLRMVLQSMVSFAYYGIGGLILAGFGKVYLDFLPGNKSKKMLVFRKLVSQMLRSVLYSNPFVKKQVHNPFGENFKKPAMIIANHSSFLDSIAVGMLHPQQIFLVNDWVYQSPFIGGVARLAGFYPTSQGLEGSVSFLQEKIAQGYSLMIFPEGTRSPDNNIRRFHKGAFYLAEKLQLDVLPVYLHGLSECIPRDDFFIYDGKITIHIGARIPLGKEPVPYSQQSKTISRMFKKQFSLLRKKEEDENYFYNKLYLSFLYKQPQVVRAVQREFQQKKLFYHQLNDFIDSQALLVHWGNDFGQIDFLLTMQQASRQVFSYISDPEKRRIAATNYLTKKRNITYMETFSVPTTSEILLLTDSQAVLPEENSGLNGIKTVLLPPDSPAISYFTRRHFVINKSSSTVIQLSKTSE
jgi:1-acyl-sn-glycerol-3-phosphate acyltransferase